MTQEDLPIPSSRRRELEEGLHHLPEVVDPGLRREGLDYLRVDQHPQVLHLLLGLKIGFLPVDRDAQISAQEEDLIHLFG